MLPSTTSNNGRDRLSLNLNVCELSGVRDVACGSRFWIVSTRSFVAETALPGEKSTRIMPREDLPDVHTKFPLHDLAAVRLDRIVRTTRGIALVFVNRQALSTGPERHTTVPTTYKITSALGFVPIKAFSAQKCGGTTSSEDAHDPLPEEMFSVGQGGSILPRENKGKTRVRKVASALEQKELFTANKKMKATNPQQNQQHEVR